MPDCFYRIACLLLGAGMLASCESLRTQSEDEAPASGASAEVGGAPVAEGSGDAASLPEAPEFRDPGGTLGLRALTRLALANSPLFAQAEGNLRIAQARRRTVGEWEDPEMRAGFDWDDIRVPLVKVPGPGNDDRLRRNEQLNTSIRFYPPNPLEIRAELHKAMAEISYAEYFLRQVGRDVVQEVRELYQELQFLQEDIALGRGLYRLERDEHERLKQLLAEGNQLRDPVDQQQRRAVSRSGITTSSEIRFQQVRARLASVVGLPDPSRIKVEGVPNRPLLGFREDTVTSLAEMAFMNNLELADLDRLQKLAEGDLKAFKARKVPWLSFIEAGRDRSYSRHLAINDTWSVRLAMNVPIFSLFSKEGGIYREQIRSYQKQAERFRQQIERKIASAVASVKEARAGLGRYDAETENIIAELQEMEARVAEAAPQKQAELAHMRRVTALDRSRDRLEAEEAYHKALLELERIIRADIETVFHQQALAAGEDA